MIFSLTENLQSISQSCKCDGIKTGAPDRAPAGGWGGTKNISDAFLKGAVVCPLLIWKFTRVIGEEDMELLNAKDVARLLKVSLPLVYKMADRGQLACVRWDCPGEGERKKTTLRFELEALRDFIEKHRQNGEKRT